MSTKRTIFSIFLLLPAFAGLVLMPEEAAGAAREGLRLCGGVIIPALFPFLVLSSLTVSLGLAASLGRVLSPVTGRLLGITPAGTGALTLGLIGGYPVGAKTVRQLWERGQCSYEESIRLLTFCNNCGPAFLVGVAGGTVFHSAGMGGLLWAAHVLGALTVGVVLGWMGNGEGKEPQCPSAPCPVECISFSQALTGAVSSGLQSTLSICGYVVLFRVILRFFAGGIGTLTDVPNGAALFSGLLEMSTGVTALRPDAAGAAPLASFLLGVGGLSVWCQTAAMLDGSDLPMRPVCVGKLLHGVFAAGWTLVLLWLFPQSAQTMAVEAVPLVQHSLSWLHLAVTGGSWTVFLLSLSHLMNTNKRE